MDVPEKKKEAKVKERTALKEIQRKIGYKGGQNKSKHRLNAQRRLKPRYVIFLPRCWFWAGRWGRGCAGSGHWPVRSTIAL